MRSGPKRKPTTAALYRDYLHRHVLPDIGRVKAVSVGRATVAKVHMKVGKRHPVAANRTIAVVSAMFAFAEKRGLLPAGHVNPARGIDKFPETGRERFLTTEELERLGSAIREAETVGVPWDVDETKPTAKHIPKRDRQTVISPFAGAAIRPLAFHRMPIARNPRPSMDRGRFRAWHVAPAGLENRQEERHPQRPCSRRPRRPAPLRRVCHRRRNPVPSLART